ncbi:hypothetical protein VTI28DRAFT_10389 [Corynascus sepedonium]
MNTQMEPNPSSEAGTAPRGSHPDKPPVHMEPCRFQQESMTARGFRRVVNRLTPAGISAHHPQLLNRVCPTRLPITAGPYHPQGFL